MQYIRVLCGGELYGETVRLLWQRWRDAGGDYTTIVWRWQEGRLANGIKRTLGLLEMPCRLPCLPESSILVAAADRESHQQLPTPSSRARSHVLYKGL